MYHSMDKRKHTHTCTHTCTHMHTHAHTCTHTHAHTHAHTHTDARRRTDGVVVRADGNARLLALVSVRILTHEPWVLLLPPADVDVEAAPLAILGNSRCKGRVIAEGEVRCTARVPAKVHAALRPDESSTLGRDVPELDAWGKAGAAKEVSAGRCCGKEVAAQLGVDALKHSTTG